MKSEKGPLNTFPVISAQLLGEARKNDWTIGRMFNFADNEGDIFAHATIEAIRSHAGACMIQLQSDYVSGLVGLSPEKYREILIMLQSLRSISEENLAEILNTKYSAAKTSTQTNHEPPKGDYIDFEDVADSDQTQETIKDDSEVIETIHPLTGRVERWVARALERFGLTRAHNEWEKSSTKSRRNFLWAVGIGLAGLASIPLWYRTEYRKRMGDFGSDLERLDSESWKKVQTLIQRFGHPNENNDLAVDDMVGRIVRADLGEDPVHEKTGITSAGLLVFMIARLLSDMAQINPAKESDIARLPLEPGETAPKTAYETWIRLTEAYADYLRTGEDPLHFAAYTSEDAINIFADHYGQIFPGQTLDNLLVQGRKKYEDRDIEIQSDPLEYARLPKNRPHVMELVNHFCTANSEFGGRIPAEEFAVTDRSGMLGISATQWIVLMIAQKGFDPFNRATNNIFGLEDDTAVSSDDTWKKAWQEAYVAYTNNKPEDALRYNFGIIHDEEFVAAVDQEFGITKILQESRAGSGKEGKGVLGFADKARNHQEISSAKYIEKYKNLAIENQKNYGVPASITLAQGLLESTSGNSSLAVDWNNHFGIKCFGNKKHTPRHRDCKPGRRCQNYHDDNEYDRFVVFDSPAASYARHARMLSQGRYKFLHAETPTTWGRIPDGQKGENTNDSTKWANARKNWDSPHERWAYGLDALGYATDSGYAKKLLGLIKKFNLTQYDA